MNLDDQIGLRLLNVARRAIHAAVAGEPRLDDREPWDAVPHAGVFVTLRKFSHLRGCIGTFSQDGALHDVVADIAAAATRDPRFHIRPIAASELNDIRIELSVLSPRQRILDHDLFEHGRHGIYLQHGYHVGCFLPDVGADVGWDRETFLTELCRQKAGLSPDAWRDPQTELHVFTVRKFCENPPRLEH